MNSSPIAELILNDPEEKIILKRHLHFFFCYVNDYRFNRQQKLNP